jgi:hypothetical protein
LPGEILGRNSLRKFSGKIPGKDSLVIFMAVLEAAFKLMILIGWDGELED